MLNSIPEITVLPNIMKMTQKTAMILFFIFDIIPNFGFGLYFILLNIFEIYLLCKVRFNFTDDRYKKFAAIRLIFYLISIIFLVFLAIYKYQHNAAFSFYIYLIFFAFFILWNIYMTLKFKTSIEHSTQIHGYLGDDDLSENILNIKDFKNNSDKIDNKKLKKDSQEKLLIEENGKNFLKDELLKKKS